MVKRLQKQNTFVIVIDFQEKLLPAMRSPEELEDTTAKFIAGAKVLGLPVVVTQQYTKGLGETTGKIREALGDFTPIEKKSFSAFGAEEFAKAVEALGRKAVLVAGIESHICVEQTVLDFLEKGCDVFVVADCISSRKETDKKMALKRMLQAGAVPVTYEAALYEMLEVASGDEFKTISKIVK